MQILVSNDDGVNAPGLHALVKALQEVGEVFVVAPDRNRSGASNSLTLVNPLRLQTLDNGHVSVAGTPTDCVHIALTGLWPDKKFDIVVSGINAGANLGDDVLYSGTVAAAMEGRILGLPAIAISLVSNDSTNFAAAAKTAKNLVERIIKDPLPASTILNVNVPDIPYEEVSGFEVVRLGTRHVAEGVINAIDPRGAPIYWIGAAGEEEDAGPGTDFHAIKNSKISITPLRIDMTHYTAFEQLSNWISGA